VQMRRRATLANALHQAGYLSKAQAVFSEAEEMQNKIQHDFPFLYSQRGFHYCDLLLSQGNDAEVKRRASQTLEWAKQYRLSLLVVALDNPSLGRALALTLPSPSGRGVSAGRSEGDAITYLNRAVDGLRQAGQQQELPRGLLARAAYYRVTGDLNKAQKNLDEAFSIASRGGMGLYLADCHLEYARLALARGEKEKAREHWQIAKDSIEKMGYHRRDKEVEELEEQLN
jgi:tetratricopeptide (TPR) repeat protein